MPSGLLRSVAGLRTTCVMICWQRDELVSTGWPSIGLAEAAVGFFAQDGVAVLIFDFVVEADVVVVRGEVEVAERREHESVGERFAGFVFQRRAAVAAAVEADVAEVAVADVDIGFVAAAEVIVGAAGTRSAQAGIQIRQIRCAEAGRIRSACEQAVDRTEFESERIGEFARRVVAVFVAVVAAGAGEREFRQDRRAEFAACAGVIARTDRAGVVQSVIRCRRATADRVSVRNTDCRIRRRRRRRPIRPAG